MATIYLVINSHDQVLDLVVHDQYDGATGASEHVGEGSLEEGAGAFLFGDGHPAVSGALVDDFALGTSRLHHHTPTDGVEGIRDDAGHGGHGLKVIIAMIMEKGERRGEHVPERWPRR